MPASGQKYMARQYTACGLNNGGMHSKHLLLIVISASIVLLVACDQKPGNKASAHKGEPQFERDTSIHGNNAYNDLFLDSSHLEQFIAQQQLSDTVANNMRFFYANRNFEYAWFGSDGLTEQALAFRNLYDFQDTSSTKKSLDRTLDQILLSEESSFSESDPSIRKTELLLSWRFINHVNSTYRSAKNRESALTQLVPAKKQDIATMAQWVSDNKRMNELADNRYYPALHNALKKWMETDVTEWHTIPLPPKTLKKGSSDPVIAAIKKRLYQMGSFEKKDTGMAFNKELEAAVKKAQTAFGMKGDGLIGKTFVKQLNVPVQDRIAQILINLERMRWMPETSVGSLIIVNIPEYLLHVYEGKDLAFSMPVVVGKQGNNTVLFAGNLNQVVFNPYWNLPAGIVEKEVMPQMEKNRDYLAEHNMEVTGEEDGIPVVRQLPGDRNELGKVKFLFPNSFNIYFHDTPHKQLFGQSKRAFSHG